MCQESALGKFWEAGNVCYFLPLPSAIYYSFHVLADINNALVFHGLCRDTHAKEGAQGKQGGSSLGTQREQGWREYCRAWVGKSRSAGAAGWDLYWEEHDSREAGEGKLSLETQCKCRSSGRNWNCAQSVWGVEGRRPKRRNLPQAQEKVGGYSHQQHTAMLMDTCSMEISCLQNKIKFIYQVPLLKEAVSGVLSTAVPRC